MKQDRPPFVMYLTIVYLMAMATISTLVAVYAVRVEIPSAVEYTIDPIDAKIVCPGDTVSISYSVAVERAPVLIRQSESFWSVTDKGTVSAGASAVSYIYDKTGVYRESLTFTVPNVPPGHYEYRRGSGSSSPSATRYIAVPFVIKENCN